MRKLCHPLLFIFCIVLNFSITRCSEYEEFDGVPIRQYATTVIGFSSQYNLNPPNWLAIQALGKENVYDTSETDFGYGDSGKAWSPRFEDTPREYLVLGFDTIQTVQVIEVYETWYPGAIDTVYIRNAESEAWEIVYSKPAATNLPDSARIFKVFLPLETTYLVDEVRIALNSGAVEGWNEIDAVAISGKRRKE